jgi:hypothetical protein
MIYYGLHYDPLKLTSYYFPKAFAPFHRAKDVWRRTYATPYPLVQRLGLEAAVNGGTTKRLLATVEQTIAQAETLADAAG